MQDLKTILIGIQARSNNSRLPKKCFEPIGSKRLLDHVIDACDRSAKYSNRFTYRTKYSTTVALLIPIGDPIKGAFGSQVAVVEGSELDVLGRFERAQSIYSADYICRITGDCPLIPSYVVSKHISLAVVGGYDYLSNVDEDCRLSLDGLDCEVMSANMLSWLCENATTAEEREHVTLKARVSPPGWAKRGFTASYFDQSDLKLSVDTAEDLANVRAMYDAVGDKLLRAEKLYGRSAIHRF